MDFVAAGEQQVANTLACIGLVGMFWLCQAVKEQRQIEAVVQLVNVHLATRIIEAMALLTIVGGFLTLVSPGFTGVNFARDAC